MEEAEVSPVFSGPPGSSSMTHAYTLAKGLEFRLGALLTLQKKWCFHYHWLVSGAPNS